MKKLDKDFVLVCSGSYNIIIHWMLKYLSLLWNLDVSIDGFDNRFFPGLQMAVFWPCPSSVGVGGERQRDREHSLVFLLTRALIP